jgi:hypothetical protein
LGGATIGKTIFILKTSSPEPSGQLRTNNPWVKRIRNCLNKGPGSLPRGDNHKKIWGEVIENASSIVLKKDQVLFQGEIITFINAKIGYDHLKIFSRSTKPEEIILTGKLSDIM